MTWSTLVSRSFDGLLDGADVLGRELALDVAFDGVVDGLLVDPAVAANSRVAEPERPFLLGGQPFHRERRGPLGVMERDLLDRVAGDLDDRLAVVRRADPRVEELHEHGVQRVAAAEVGLVGRDADAFEVLAVIGVVPLEMGLSVEELLVEVIP